MLHSSAYIKPKGLHVFFIFYVFYWFWAVFTEGIILHDLYSRIAIHRRIPFIQHQTIYSVK